MNAQVVSLRQDGRGGDNDSPRPGLVFEWQSLLGQQ
jgi:hypothetical protein